MKDNFMRNIPWWKWNADVTYNFTHFTPYDCDVRAKSTQSVSAWNGHDKGTV